MNKGITPAIATVLLVAITIGAAGTLYTIVSSTQETANNQVSNVELPVGDISRESCWVANERANAQFRNNGRDSINTSYITPLVDGSIAENYTITPNGIVEPQGTFRISFNQSVYSSSPLRLARGETDRTYFCRQFPIDGPKLEIGKTEVSGSIDDGFSQTVNFENFYFEPVATVFVSSDSNTKSLDARIANVSSSNMTVFFENVTDNGAISGENISYMVAKEGSYQIDGVKIEAGSTMIENIADNVHRKGENYNGTKILFDQEFSDKPVLLHSLNSYNNGDFMTTSVSAPDSSCGNILCTPSSSGFDIQQEAGDSFHIAQDEYAGWIAIENTSSFNLGGASEVGAFEESTDDGLSQPRHNILFDQTYSNTPIVLANGYSANGKQGYWARAQGVRNESRIDLYAQEDTNDQHNNEVFSYVAFEDSWSYP